MSKSMKALLMLGGLMMVVSTAKALTTADINITVTPVGNKSVAVETATTTIYAFGSLSLNTSSVTATGITVQNDGQIPMTVGIEVANQGAPWTVANAAGEDQYNLRALFNTTRPADGDFLAADDLTAAMIPSATGTFDGDQSGLNVPPGAGSDERELWFRLAMPTTSSVTSQRDIRVQLTAN